MDILRFRNLVDVPWKNGGGITRNIAFGSCDGATAWRISRADVAENGAFSSFAGLVRVLTVVSDTGMELRYPGGVLHADPWVPVRFDGALDVESWLKDGPLTDLNLMFDPEFCEADVTVLRGSRCEALHPPVAGMTALHVLAGQPKLDTQGLGVGDTAFIDSAAVLDLGATDAVLVITLKYLDQSKAITLAIADR